jgi:phytoene desaturase
MKKVNIIGAGPGGLASALLLAKKGFEVEVFEKESQPGGRTSELNLDGYRFDVGPTFFMMKFVLDEIFQAIGKDTKDYFEFIDLSPMYRLQYSDNYMDIYRDSEKMKKELKRVFPGEEKGLDKFMKKEGLRYERLMPILLDDNNNILDAFRLRFFKALPLFSIGQNIFNALGNYFKNPLTRISFTFQAKYLGMSPWDCPAAFGIVPFVEHSQGVYHIKGGISEISRVMAKLAEEMGVKINYNSTVKEVLTEKKKAIGIQLDNGEKHLSDEVIVNPDFSYAATNLFKENSLKKYSKKNIDKKKFSCSIFIMYLGLKKQYKLEHNTIVLAKDYKKNVDDVFEGRITKKDISFYVRDHSKTDSSLAPEGKTALYVLVPVPNLTFKNIDWDKEKENLRRDVLDGLKERLDLKDVEENIEVEKIYTPLDWNKEYNVYNGSVFNLSHNLNQMLWFRPHNRFEEIKNCYLVGGGTHPGSGLPTILHSGRIAAKLILKKYGNKNK